MEYIETSPKTKENVEEIIVNLAKRIIEDIDELSIYSV